MSLPPPVPDCTSWVAPLRQAPSPGPVFESEFESEMGLSLAGSWSSASWKGCAMLASSSSERSVSLVAPDVREGVLSPASSPRKRPGDVNRHKRREG